MDAMGSAEAIEFGDVEWKVDVTEASAGIIDVRKVGGGREGVGSGSGAGGKGEVELAEHLVEYKAGEKGTEWATLRETFVLEEERP
jgi:alpha-L-arabinofuranosidase